MTTDPGRDTYLCLSTGHIDRQRQLGPHLIVDVDRDGQPVGVERTGGPFTLDDLTLLVEMYAPRPRHTDQPDPVIPGLYNTIDRLAVEAATFRLAWRELIARAELVDVAGDVTAAQRAALDLDALLRLDGAPDPTINPQETATDDH